MSDAEETSRRSGHRPKFDGTKKGWPKFALQMRGRLREKGAHTALTKRDSDLPPSADYECTGAEKDKQEAALKKFNTATYELMMAVSGVPACMVIVQNTVTDEWPEGQADKIWKKLTEKYAPRDSFTPLEKDAALKKCKIKKGEDPTLLFDKIAEVEAEFGALTDTEKIQQMMIGIPESYQNAILSVKDQKGSTATLDDYAGRLPGEIRGQISAHKDRKWYARGRRRR